MPASKEQKAQANEFLDLIKKSKGGLKVYFAVGKGGDGGAVHVDKKKPEFCVSTLKAQRVTTILASGQLKMEDQLTLYCLRDANENAVRKAFFEFFKEAGVSIPGVTESKIRVLGPKEWDSVSEDDEALRPRRLPRPRSLARKAPRVRNCPRQPPLLAPPQPLLRRPRRQSRQVTISLPRTRSWSPR